MAGFFVHFIKKCKRARKVNICLSHFFIKKRKKPHHGDLIR